MKIGYLAIALVVSIVNKNKSLNNTDKVSDYDKGYEYYKQKRYAQALPLFQRSAKQGYAKAQNTLGSMYKNGTGLKKNYTIASEWFEKAA